MLLVIKNMELYALGTAPEGEPTPLAQLLDLDLGNIPARVHIKLVRLVKRLGEEVNNILDTRGKYVRLYGEDTGGGNFRVSPPDPAEDKPGSPNWEKYKKEMEDLLAQTTKLDIEKVVLPDKVHIPGRLLMLFEAFLEIEEEPAENGTGNEPVPMKRTG